MERLTQSKKPHLRRLAQSSQSFPITPRERDCLVINRKTVKLCASLRKRGFSVPRMWPLSSPAHVSHPLDPDRPVIAPTQPRPPRLRPDHDNATWANVARWGRTYAEHEITTKRLPGDSNARTATKTNERKT